MTKEEVYNFLFENGFKDWVTDPTPTSDLFWKNWIAENPAYKKEVEDFRVLIVQISYASKIPTETEEKIIWESIQKKISERPFKVIEFFKNGFRNYGRLAASVTILCSVMAGFLLFKGTNNKEIHTAYGEIKSVELPDGSNIFLNSNSTLSYSTANWKEGNDREVTLKGEAFFEIKEQGSLKRDRFTVHTDGIDVEVLGTKFNINSFRTVTKVVLQSGSVKLSSNRPNTQPLIMKPGEMVNFDKKEFQFQLIKVNPKIYSSWKDMKFVFENTSVKEIAVIIEDKYGIKVNLLGQGLAERKISGEITIGGKQTLLKAIETLYNLKITENGNNTITISENPAKH